MNTQPAFSANQTSLPFGAGYPNSPSMGLREPARGFQHAPNNGCASAKLIPSVVEQVGIGRFVYVEGRSGKRYVFSSITPEQVSLYDKALFAAAEPGCDVVHIANDLNGLHGCGALIYVHLLDDDADSHEEVVNDLRDCVTQ